MTLKLTPDIIEAMYNYLKVTPPFCRWKLPDSDDVKFVVSADNSTFGKWVFEHDTHEIHISNKNVGFTDTLASTMAHEMIHLRHNKSIPYNAHPASFKRDAVLVCKYHGWDIKAFY